MALRKALLREAGHVIHVDRYVQVCTVVWELFDSKNISWVLHTHEKYLHEKTITTII